MKPRGRTVMNFVSIRVLLVVLTGFGLIMTGRVTGQTLTTLHHFTLHPAPVDTLNEDGARPYAGLILSSDTLYGTTYQGDSWRVGTVFALSTDGTGFTNLHSFSWRGDDGARSFAPLILSSNILYG